MRGDIIRACLQTKTKNKTHNNKNKKNSIIKNKEVWDEATANRTGSYIFHVGGRWPTRPQLTQKIRLTDQVILYGNLDLYSIHHL